MTEVENLVLEHLKRFQVQLSRMEDRLEALVGDLRGVRQHMAAFMTSEINRDAEMATFRMRLERIERRLDLVD